MSAPTSPADLVILGGGSGGYAAAFRASELGLNVVLIEKDKVGGTCLHRGCIPTKALLHAGEVADLAREGEQFGVKTTLAGIDMDGVNSYKDGVVSKLYKGLQGLVKARKITYVEGEGRLTSPTTVEVNGESYEGKHILLATGSYARSLPGLEIDGTRVITSDHALNLDRVPASAIILGGGVSKKFDKFQPFLHTRAEIVPAASPAGRVEVIALDRQGRPHGVRAERVIFAAGQFVAGRGLGKGDRKSHSQQSDRFAGKRKRLSEKRRQRFYADFQGRFGEARRCRRGFGQLLYARDGLDGGDERRGDADHRRDARRL